MRHTAQRRSAPPHTLWLRAPAVTAAGGRADTSRARKGPVGGEAQYPQDESIARLLGGAPE